MKIFIDGHFYIPEEAKISILDRGFLYGDGIFETMAVYHGKIFRLQQHLERLYQSAKAIAFTIPHSPDELTQYLYQTITENTYQPGLLRLTLSRGIGVHGLDPDACIQPTVAILPFPAKSYSEKLKQGAHVIIANTRHIPPACLNPGIKCANYLVNILAYREAMQCNADEAIMLNLDGFITEGSTSNIFFIKDKTTGPTLLKSLFSLHNLIY